jgi:hypothetical protein
VLLGVLGFQGVIGRGGDSVQGLISSFNSTAPRSTSTRLVALKLALILSNKKTC